MMSTVNTRRSFLLGLAVTAAAARALASGSSPEDRLALASGRLAAIEKREGGRLGVTVLDSDGGPLLKHRADERFPMCSTFKLLASAAVLRRVDEGKERLDRVIPYGPADLLEYAPVAKAHLADGGGPLLKHRADERFPMCSTFKLLASAAVLRRVDEGNERLDRVIPYGPADLLEYAPVAKAHVADGGMPLGELCAAAIDWSDNTAANLILEAIGGPAGFTAFVRSLGDSTTRLDRNEPGLNASVPGDERDTTTPLAMAADTQKALLGDVLSEASRGRLEAWLVNDKVGDKRLRAGLPASWTIGDKTGSGDHGTANVIAIIRPPGRAPLIAAVYYTESDAPMDVRNAIHKEIGGIIGETF